MATNPIETHKKKLIIFRVISCYFVVFVAKSQPVRAGSSEAEIPIYRGIENIQSLQDRGA